MNLQFDLPATDDAAEPVFSTAKECAEWIEALPMGNAATAQAQLRAQLALLPIAGLKPALLLDIVECLRQVVVPVQAEMAKRYSFRPLPLAEMEANVLSTAQNLWHGLCLCYQVCVQSILDGERELKGQAAVVCQRALDAQVRLILDTICAGSEVPPADWLLMHKLYSAAEIAGVAAEKVKDALLKAVGATHCMATYARPLLLSLGLPADINQRLTLPLIFWTERLANRVVITSLPPPKPAKPPVLVDVAAGQGGFRPENADSAAGGKTLRYVDISGLAMALKKRIHRLRKGDTPASLGFGEEVSAPVLEQTLIALYKHWGDGRVGRELPRRVAGVKAQAVAGMAAIYCSVTGKPFRQPAPGPEMSTRQMREIATFGRDSGREDDESVSMQGFALEDWTLQDESVGGLRMMRSVTADGARVAPGTLVAVKPADARAFMIGVVRWAQVQVAGHLVVGVRSLPGAPLAMALRQTGVNAVAEKYHPGLMLPAVPVLLSPASVLVPSGWFKPGRVLEVYGGATPRISLDALAEHLGEFDRCTYTGI
jgi:hypothetical protein